MIGEEIALPRDRDSTFEPQIVAKPGSNDRVISLNTRGLSFREIQAHLLEL